MTESFHRERINAVSIKGKRYYVLPNGETVPSVTSVLSILPKAALDNWKLKTVATFAVDNVNDWAKADEKGTIVTRLPYEATVDTLKKGPGWDSTARDNGEIVHKIAEDILLNRKPYVPAGFERATQYVHEFVEEFAVELIAAEPQLINYSVGYAGSADLIAKVHLPDSGDVIAVLDYKSGSGLYGSTAYQCCAYAHAESWIATDENATEKSVKESMGDITHSFGVWLRPSGWAMYSLSMEEPVWGTFRAARYLFDTTSNDWEYRSKPINEHPIRSAGPAWGVLEV